MKRREYIERLEQLLLILPQEEREEALQYYSDYFDDAGEENEDKVILELGSPEEVAAKIRAGYAGEYAEYSEQGYEDARFQSANEIMVDGGTGNCEWKDSVYEAEREGQATGRKREKSNNTNIWKVIAIVLIGLIAGPVVFPLGIALVAVVFAIFVALVAVVAALAFSGLGIGFAGIIIIGAGLARLLLAPAAGLLAAGIGCILLAIGIVLAWVMISLAVKVVPGLIRGVVNLLGRPFRKAGAK